MTETKKKFDKKSTDEFKSYIENRFKEYLDKYIIIDFVDINFNYNLNNSIVSGELGGEVVFDCSYIQPYRQFHVNIHKMALTMWETGNIKKLEDGIIHELAHLHTSKLADMAEDRFTSKKQLMEVNEELTHLISEYIRRFKYLTDEILSVKGRTEKTKQTKPRRNEASKIKKLKK